MGIFSHTERERERWMRARVRECKRKRVCVCVRERERERPHCLAVLVSVCHKLSLRTWREPEDMDEGRGRRVFEALKQ